MPPKYKFSLSMLESKLYPIVQRHHEKLQELKLVYDESKLCFNDVEQKLKGLSQNDTHATGTSILSKEDEIFIENTVTYKRRPVTIFMGQRNCGKSSLLNEVLRKSCLPTHENPCTARMIRLTYGSESVASLVDGDNVLNKVPCKKQRVPSELVNLAEDCRHDIAEVRKLVLAEIDLPVLQCGVDFIDSPGFGENVILDQVIENFINEDIEPVILYVINGQEMLRKQDTDAILHLKQTFPRIPIIFVINKIDIDVVALRHDLGDSDDEEADNNIEESIRDQKQLINQRVTAIFDKLKKPCHESGLTFLPQGAEFGNCDYFHTVSSRAFRRARLAKDTETNDCDCQYIDSFLKFEESFVNVLNQNLKIMDEKLVTRVTMYLQGMTLLMGRAHFGIREAVENLPFLTKVANDSEQQMRSILNTFIDKYLGDKKLFEKAAKTKEFKDLLLFSWTQVEEAGIDAVSFMCSGPNTKPLLHLFDLDEDDLQGDIQPGSSLAKSIRRLWYVSETRSLTVAKLSEQVNADVTTSNTEVKNLLELLFNCQKTLKDPYIKLLLERVYCNHSLHTKKTRGGSFSTMMISTATYGMYNSINKGIVEGIGEEIKRLYKGSDLKKLFPSAVSINIGGKKWTERFADNLIEYLQKNSRRISKLICEHAAKELETMHVVFVNHIHRLEALADEFKAQGREELVDIGKQFRPRIYLLTLRAHALRCQFSKGSLALGEKLRAGDTAELYRCADDMCGWCFDKVDGLYHRSVVARVVHLDAMTAEKKARYVRDLVYAIELAENCQDNKYLLRFYGILMPTPCTVHILVEEMNTDLLSWLQIMPRSMPNRIRVALQVAKGLKALHDRNIVFLDIKANSILIARSGEAKLNLCKPESAMATTPLGVPFHLHKKVYSEYACAGYHSLFYDIYAMGMLLWVLCEGSGTTSPFPKCKDHDEMCAILELAQIPSEPQGTPKSCWRLMEACWRQPETLKISDFITVLEKQLMVL